MRLHCSWCGKPVKFSRDEIKRRIEAFLKYNGMFNTYFGIFCSGACREKFKRWLDNK